MATRQEVLAEAYKRGLLPDEKRRAYEEALDRGLVSSQPERQEPRAETPIRGALVPSPLEFLGVVDRPETKEEAQRQLGLDVRSVVEGVSGLATFVPDLVGAGIEAATGRQVLEPLAPIVSEGLTKLGLPRPETAGERIRGATVSGAAGGSGFGKNVLQKTIGGISGSVSGASSQVAAEAGASPLTQAAIGLGVGIGAGAGVGALRRVDPTGDSATILQDLKQGIPESQAIEKVGQQVRKASERELKKLFGVVNKQGKKIKQGLFDEAERRGADALAPTKPWKDLAEELDSRSLEVVGAETKDMLTDISTKLKRLTAPEVGRVGVATVGQSKRPSINDIQGLRRQLSAISNSGGREASEASQLAKRFDKIILDNIDDTLGDKDGIRVWQKAIRGRREFALKFEEPTKIAKAIKAESPEVVEQLFIGSGGTSLNKDLSTIYENVRKALPANQRKDAAQLMRQSIVNRMVRTAVQNVDGAADELSSMRLSNQIQNFRLNNKSMWQNFTKQEQNILTSLEKDLRGMASGNAITRTADALSSLLSRASRVQIPRTLKPKTIVTVNELLDLTKVKPESLGKRVGRAAGKSVLPSLLGAQ